MPPNTRRSRRRGRRDRSRWRSRRPSVRMVVRSPIQRTELHVTRCYPPARRWPSVERRGVFLDQALLLRVLLVVLAYFAGSIPVGVIVARASGGPDPRTIGSGRTGGTNALRALGRKWAAVVVAGDLAKGAVPVLLARWATGGDPAVEVGVAFAAVLGSSRSIFLGFKGGRGVGTGVGTMLVIQPVAVILAAPVFILVILATRYVSLGSLLGSAAVFPAM